MTHSDSSSGEHERPKQEPLTTLAFIREFSMLLQPVPSAVAELFSLSTKENMRKFIVVALCLVDLCGIRATSQPAATSPTKVVTDLYSAHKGKADPLQYPASKKLLGAYFEKGLLSLFLKDQSESQGEVGKLDFDPLYAAQDFEIKDFSVVLVAQQKDSAEVAASFKNMGTNEKIVFLLSNTAQGWRITDIKYSDGRTLKGILK
jgi:Protein of unknown function (DUF3828)